MHEDNIFFDAAKKTASLLDFGFSIMIPAALRKKVGSELAKGKLAAKVYADTLRIYAKKAMGYRSKVDAKRYNLTNLPYFISDGNFLTWLLLKHTAK